MKIKELKEKLQKILDTYDWKQVKDHSQFHLAVNMLLEKEIPEGLCLGIWSVYSDSVEDKVLEYYRNFVKDGRCSEYTNRGKFSNVRIEIANSEFTNFDLNQIKIYFLKKRRLEQIKSLTEQVASLKNELTITEKALDEVKATEIKEV